MGFDPQTVTHIGVGSGEVAELPDCKAETRVFGGGGGGYGRGVGCSGLRPWKMLTAQGAPGGHQGSHLVGALPEDATWEAAESWREEAAAKA